MPVSVSAFLIFYALVIPIGICIVLDHRPGWFRRGKILLWIAGLSAFSWGGVVGAILLPYCCGLSVPRGPELVFALFFGWSYLWFASFPVFLIYGTLRLIRRVSRAS